MTTIRDSNRFTKFNGRTLTFPSSFGAADQIIKTNGSGTLAYTLNLNGIIGGSVLYVDPSAPGAADDGDPRTPFITIQAAIDEAPENAIVYIAPNEGIPYAENMVLDRSISLKGFAPSKLAPVAYTYIYGYILIPDTATGSAFHIDGVYLENVEDNVANFVLEAPSDLLITNSAVYNYNAGANAHNIDLQGGTNGCNIYALDSDFGAETGMQVIKRTGGTSFVTLYAIRSDLGSPTELSGTYAGCQHSRFSGITALADSFGKLKFDGCEFIAGISTSSAVDVLLTKCNFSGDGYSNYVTASAGGIVYVSDLSFVNSNVDAGGKPKTVSGATEFRLDGLTKEVRLNTVTTINGASATPTTLYTAPSITGYLYYLTKVNLRITSATGLTGTLTAGVGVASGEDDIFSASVLTGFNAVNEIYTFNGLGVSKAVSPSEAVKLGIDSAFGGTVNIEAQIFGYVVRT